jgi:expansin (peptidoglycan-binding protein)
MSHPMCSTGPVKTNTNLNHNIWNNNGTWWAHYTVHNDDYTKQRVRVSLGTSDVEIARALRDFIIQAAPEISSRIPRSRGQAMPDLVPALTASRRPPSRMNTGRGL